jgi:hypothetical protein
MWKDRFGTVFQRLTNEEQTGFIDDRLKKLPLIEEGLVRRARDALVEIKPLCLEALDKEVHKYLVETVYLLGVSSRDGQFPPTQNLNRC